MEDLDKIRYTLKKVWKKPKIYIPIVLFIIFAFVFISFLGGFFSEKGKQFAEPGENITDVPVESKMKPEQEKTNKAGSTEQKTEGKQSPNIIADGDVIIEYGEVK